MAEAVAFLSDVLAGLGGSQKAIPGKYLWDEAGSLLFEAVCANEHYYVARRESALLRQVASEIAQRVGTGARLVEFGSGACDKVRILLDALPAPSRYVAIDISGAYLEAAAARMTRDYPALEIVPICGDYSGTIQLPPRRPSEPTLGFFPGTTAGNFNEAGLVGFLQRARATLGAGWLLVGADPNQDASSLARAYGDGNPAMACFHENLLARVVRELGGTLDPGNFRHQARLAGPPVRVEAHLVATEDAIYRIGDVEIGFTKGESIHTDDSRKHTPEEFRALARQAGWEAAACWVDAEGLFSLHLLRG